MGLRVRIPRGGMDVCLLWTLYFVKAGRCLCDRPIPRLEEPYRVCQNECVYLSAPQEEGGDEYDEE